jgi:hypothetical protein
MEKEQKNGLAPSAGSSAKIALAMGAPDDEEGWFKLVKTRTHMSVPDPPAAQSRSTG